MSEDAPFTLERTEEQQQKLEDALLNVPGGRHLLTHVDDPPYHLVTLPDFDGADVPYQLAPFVETCPYAVLSYWDGHDVTQTRVYLMSQLGFETVAWYSNSENGICVDVTLSEPAYDTLPTSVDLARHVAHVVDPCDTSERLEQVLVARSGRLTSEILPLLEAFAHSATSPDDVADAIVGVFA